MFQHLNQALQTHISSTKHVSHLSNRLLESSVLLFLCMSVCVFLWQYLLICLSPVTAVACTGAAVLFPDIANTLMLYRVPGTSEVKPDWGAAEDITLVLRTIPEWTSFKVISYQSTCPAEGDQRTRSPEDPT